MTKLKFNEADFWAKVDEARRLAAKAKIKASAEFERFVQGARDLLGDRPKLQEAIRVWIQAAGMVTSAEGNLAEVENNAAYWEGEGAQEFEKWVNRVKMQNMTNWKTTLGSSGGASGAIIASLNKASTAVGEFLNGLYDALVTLVTGLVDAIGSGISGFLKKAADPGAIVEAATKAFSAFANAANTLFKTAITTMTEYDAAGNDIVAAAKTLSELKPPGNGISDLGMKPTVGVR